MLCHLNCAVNFTTRMRLFPFIFASDADDDVDSIGDVIVTKQSR